VSQTDAESPLTQGRRGCEAGVASQGCKVNLGCRARALRIALLLAVATTIGASRYVEGAVIVALRGLGSMDHTPATALDLGLRTARLVATKEAP
jgi:hypothetical protein